MTKNPKPAPEPSYGDAAKRLEEILRAAAGPDGGARA